MILDTNALSAFAKGNPRIRELIIDTAGHCLPVVVLGEYRFGLMSLPILSNDTHFDAIPEIQRIGF